MMESEADKSRSRASTRRVLVAAFAVVVGGWVGWAALQAPELPDFVASGDAIDVPADGAFPPVTLEEFEGMLVGLRGRPVVVNVWASWCAPCRTEMSLLQAAADAYAGRAVLLGVASNDDPDEAQAFLTELGLTYPNVFDRSGEIRVALGLTAYPTTYVFDSAGSLRARVNGGISEQRLAGLIEDVLE